jgi:hypothetical protein
MGRPRNRNYKMVPGVEPAIDALKYEIAKNLGIQETIDTLGWTALTTLDAGNIGGAIQQIINELGQTKLLEHYRAGTIKDIMYLSKGTQPEQHDLTRTRLINKVAEQSPEFQAIFKTSPGQPVVADGPGMDQMAAH